MSLEDKKLLLFLVSLYSLQLKTRKAAIQREVLRAACGFDISELVEEQRTIGTILERHKASGNFSLTKKGKKKIAELILT